MPWETRAWHNVKRNEITRIPQRHVFVDTEAYSERRNGTETQQWRCGYAVYATRGRDGGYTTHDSSYSDPKALWDSVSNFAGSTGRTIVWAHNAGYDIRIACVFEILPALGWSLKGHNIATRGTWLEWRRDGQTLIIVDSWSVFNTSIERIGQWFGIGKLPLPGEDAELATWTDRCRSDCWILATAILRYLCWIRESDLGNWQMTGNAQAWATFRHKFLTHKLTVHDDEEALKAERRAMWAGRCEAFWRGKLWETRVFEYDFTNSYPRIAKNRAVPVKYIGEMPMGRDWSEWLGSESVGFIADCTVTTEVPVVPCERDGRIVWPVGMFNTTLWDVEIDSVLDNGGTVTVHRGWMYRKAPALQAWAEWILSQVGAGEDEVEPWLRSVLKHWSRALIGRFAMTYRKWDYDGEMPCERIESGIFVDMDTDEVSKYVQIGTSMWTDGGREEWKHSMPMITGFIQAVARVDLWDVLRRMPFRSVMYCDTDSLFVTAEFQEDIERVIAEIPDCGMRLKRAWDGIEILGPRQVITGEENRISGVPKAAQKTGKGEFKGEVWESLLVALQFGKADTVRVRERNWTVEGTDHRRQGQSFGFTEPFRMTLE